MAQAALSWADEVVLILPRVLPHKEFEGITAQDRVALLAAVAAARRFSAATAEGGLYVEMADEAAAYFGADTEIGLVCGRDAAERIAAWDYGRPGVFDEMIARYPLLVAGRAGEYRAAPQHTGRVIHLALGDSFHEVSSTDIRRRIAADQEWRSLVPAEIAARLERLYRHGVR
jgi:nicotinic acid mononucleotide adenylyltransferase